MKKTHQFLGIDIPEEVLTLATKNKLIFAFACPIDVEIENSEGNFINKNQSQIEGAYFYSDGKDDGYKIVEIQNPEGEYFLKITGNGEGVYDGSVYKIDEDENIFTEFNGEIISEEEINYDIVFENSEINIIKREEDEVEEDVEIVVADEEDEIEEDVIIATEDEVEDETDDDEKKKDKKKKKEQEQTLGYVKNIKKKKP